MPTDPRTFKTTETSFSVVQTIQELESASFMTLKAELGLPKSTLYYHLNTLERMGYVVKSDGEYQLGLRFISLADSARQKQAAFGVVLTNAQNLASKIPEEVDFSVEENGRLVVVYHRAGGGTLAEFKLGQYLYMHATAGGKALLAELSQDRINDIIDRWGLAQLTEKTITERATLIDELETVRDQGYAINDEEQRDGLRSVAAKITKPDGTILGALTIDGPTYRLTQQEIENNTARVLFDTIDDIETDLEKGDY